MGVGSGAKQATATEHTKIFSSQQSYSSNSTKDRQTVELSNLKKPPDPVREKEGNFVLIEQCGIVYKIPLSEETPSGKKGQCIII
jgi:hypothetical protein